MDCTYGSKPTVNSEWRRLRRSGWRLPTIAVRDIVVPQRESDLVVATFGRSFYVLDDLSALRTVNRATLDQEAALFPMRDSLMYIQSTRIGGRNQTFQGDSFYVAPNPAFGA